MKKIFFSEQVNLYDSSVSPAVNAIKKGTWTLIKFFPLHGKRYSLLLLPGYQHVNVTASYFMQIDSCASTIRTLKMFIQTINNERTETAFIF